jgi:hypothetical protein
MLGKASYHLGNVTKFRNWDLFIQVFFFAYTKLIPCLQKAFSKSTE